MKKMQAWTYFEIEESLLVTRSCAYVVFETTLIYFTVLQHKHFATNFRFDFMHPHKMKFHQCLYVFLTCSKTSCIIRDVTRYHQWCNWQGSKGARCPPGKLDVNDTFKRPISLQKHLYLVCKANLFH